MPFILILLPVIGQPLLPQLQCHHLVSRESSRNLTRNQFPDADWLCQLPLRVWFVHYLHFICQHALISRTIFTSVPLWWRKRSMEEEDKYMFKVKAENLLLWFLKTVGCMSTMSTSVQLELTRAVLLWWLTGSEIFIAEVQEEYGGVFFLFLREKEHISCYFAK